MIVQAKLNTFDTPKRMRAMREQIGSKTMHQLGNTAIGIIRTRTLLGRDMRGASFAAYSTKPFYAPTKRRPAGYPMPAGGRATKAGTFFGRQTEGGRTMYFAGGWRQYKAGIGRGTRPQLSVSEKMLNDMQVISESDKAIIYFGSARSAAIAHGHQFGTSVPRREFFGIGEQPREVSDMENELADLLIEYARRAHVPMTGR